MGQAAEKLEPRIYVACLAAYNNGWLWAPDEKPVRVAQHGKKKMAAKPAVKTTVQTADMSAAH